MPSFSDIKQGVKTWLNSTKVPHGKKLGPRVKYHNKTESKTTISLYLDKNLVQQAKNHSLNLSKITEQALSSILDYVQA